MNSFIKKILLIFILLTLLIVAILAYHDFFTSPKVTEKEMGPYLIATKRFVGSYYKVGPTMTEVDTQLRNLGVKSTLGIGLYYDSPAQKKENELRSDVGNVLENVNEITLTKIKKELDVKEIKKQKAVVVAYPIKSPLSYMLGAMKVYPAITQYWQEKKYPNSKDGYGVEIYDIPGKITYYFMYIPE